MKVNSFVKNILNFGVLHNTIIKISDIELNLTIGIVKLHMM